MLNCTYWIFICIVCVCTGPEVYSFPFFTEQFCDQFTAELDHIEGSPVPKGRPNTMNNYGVSYSTHSKLIGCHHGNQSPTIVITRTLGHVCLWLPCQPVQATNIHTYSIVYSQNGLAKNV